MNYDFYTNDPKEYKLELERKYRSEAVKIAFDFIGRNAEGINNVETEEFLSTIKNILDLSQYIAHHIMTGERNTIEFPDQPIVSRFGEKIDLLMVPVE